MTPRAPHDLEAVEAILQKACGLTLSPALRKALQSSVNRAAETLGIDEGRFRQRLLAGDADSVSCLVEHSVIGETYFFRHSEQFQALHQRLTTDFTDEAGLLVWSAGCATGEEPYSLSMALLDAGRARRSDRIVATDISERSLKTAREAVYGRWSLRRMEPHVRSRHFEALGADRFRVNEPARKRVEFRRQNLVLDPAPVSGCHLVFCRNVLIYFEAPTAAKVLHTLADALAPGGYLVLGPVEVPLAATLALEWVECQGATLLRRPDGRPVSKPVAPALSRPPARRPTPPGLRTRSRPHMLATPVPPAQVLATAEQEFGTPRTRFEAAREAARQGRLDEAEQLARAAAAEDMSPESYLLLSMAAESRGDLRGAVEHARKALYLDPMLASGHALLVALFHRLGRPDEAERSRRNALHALEGLDEAVVLKGVEAITAGALRRALEQTARR